MITFYVNEQALDLPSDFSITFNFKSPIFNDIGSFTYPVKVPFTPRNCAILKFKHRLENTGDPYEKFPCRIQVNDHSIIGIFKCSISNRQNGYEGAVYLVNGDFYYGNQNTNLRDLDMGKLLFPDEATGLAWINDCQGKYYPDVPCAFPYIFDDCYFDPKTTEDFQKYINNHFGGFYEIVEFVPSITPDERTIIIPFPYLRYVLDQIFKSLNYDFEDRFFARDPELSRLILFNTASCNHGGMDYNCSFLNKLYFNFHVPDIKVIDFLTGLENMFNIKFFINTTTQKVKLICLDDVIKDADFVEFSKNILLQSTELETQITGIKVSMQLDSSDNILPSLSQWDAAVLADIRGTLHSFADLPKFPMALQGNVYYIQEEGCYYQMTGIDVWHKLSSIAPMAANMMVGDGSTVLETKFSPLWHDVSLENDDDISACTYKSTDTYQPRLVFAKMFLNNQAHKYGMYSNHSLVNHSLLFTTDNGLNEKFWNYYLRWRMSTKLVKTTKQIDINDLFNLDFSKKFMMLGIKSLLSSVQVTIKSNSIDPALIEHYPCP